MSKQTCCGVKQREQVTRWLVCALVGLLIVMSVVLTGCNKPSVTPTPDPGSVTETRYMGKKVLYVDSYHAGYEWSDAIDKGMQEVFEGTGVELKVVRMDTKRNSGAEYGQEAALRAKAEIEAFEPDVLIACDDNAQKYLVVPHYKDTSLPVIFCGVNWDATEYGYPASNVTGMIEIDFVVQMVENLKPYAKGDRVGYLSGDTSTDRKLADIYNDRFFDGQMSTYYAKTFEEFKAAFVRAQGEVDILYFGNNAGIEGWDDREAETFILQESKVPSGTRQPHGYHG